MFVEGDQADKELAAQLAEELGERPVSFEEERGMSPGSISYARQPA